MILGSHGLLLRRSARRFEPHRTRRITEEGLRSPRRSSCSVECLDRTHAERTGHAEPGPFLVAVRMSRRDTCSVEFNAEVRRGPQRTSAVPLRTSANLCVESLSRWSRNGNSTERETQRTKSLPRRRAPALCSPCLCVMPKSPAPSGRSVSPVCSVRPAHARGTRRIAGSSSVLLCVLRGSNAEPGGRGSSRQRLRSIRQASRRSDRLSLLAFRKAARRSV
jgi:hypothetical protein